jgi:hypothetical protein
MRSRRGGNFVRRWDFQTPIVRIIQLRRRIICMILCAVMLMISASQVTRGANNLEPSGPVFKAQLINGQIVTGRLAGISDDGSFRMAPSAGPSEELAPSRIFKLTRDVPPLTLGADGASLIFPGGDRLTRLTIGTATENSLEVTSNLFGKLKIPLESLLGVIFNPPSDQSALDTLWNHVQYDSRNSEVVWMANGDRRIGGFLGLDDRSLKLQVDSKPIVIDRTGVNALGFDPNLVSYPLPESPILEVSLAEGTRLGLSGYQLDRDQLSGVTRFGQRIHFPLAEVVCIYVRSHSVEFLSERTAAGVQYVPYVGPPRPYRIDRAVDGRPFVLSGQSYERGLGMQSRTLIAYKLKADDKRFQAMVGLDDRAGPLGSVGFRVLVDGKERFATPALSVREPAQSIDIDLEGAKTLILITEYGDRGDVQDLADWVDARIIH